MSAYPIGATLVGTLDTPVLSRLPFAICAQRHEEGSGHPFQSVDGVPDQVTSSLAENELPDMSTSSPPTQKPKAQLLFKEEGTGFDLFYHHWCVID